MNTNIYELKDWQRDARRAVSEKTTPLGSVLKGDLL